MDSHHESHLGLPPAPTTDDAALCAVLARLRAHAFAVDHDAGLIWYDSAVEPLRPVLLDPSVRERLCIQIQRLKAGKSAERMTISPDGDRGETHWEIDLLAWTPAGGNTANDGICAVALCRDVSLEHNLRAALADSRQRYKDLVEASSDFTWECDQDGKFAFVSTGGAWGYTADELIGQLGESLFLDHEDSRDSPFTARRKIEDAEIWLRAKNGAQVCALVAGVPLYGESGQWRGVRGLCRDITALRERERELDRVRHRDLLLTYIVRAIRDVIDPNDMLDSAVGVSARGLNARACRLYRCGNDGEWRIAAEYGDPPTGNDDLTARLDGKAGLIRFDHATGRPIALKTQYRRAVNGAVALWRRDDEDWREDEMDLIGEIAGQLGIAIEQVSNHEELKRISTRDALTGLYNRRAFFDIMNRRIAHARRTDRPGAMCYVDFDNFKTANDVHGHQHGDNALKRLTRLLTEQTRANDIVARLGGDEFAVWLEETDEDGAQASARKLLDESHCLIEFSGSPDKPLGISIGIAVYRPDSGESLELLLQRADAAMYRVKKSGKGDFAIAPPADAASGNQAPVV